MVMIVVAAIIISLLQLVFILGLAYYYLLLAANLVKPKPAAAKTPPAPVPTRFAIAIPAHNEAAVIAATVKRLGQQRYPPEQFDIYVVADHCDDDTASLARANGASCYERRDQPHGRKAYALAWLFERILSRGQAYQAIVVFDADSQVEPDFLAAMHQALGSGRPALQGQHIIVRPETSRFSQLAAVDMRLNNLLRNHAKQQLGLSGRLMGDGMAFATALLRQYGWPADSLVEDREYGLFLLTQGVRVGYVPAAVSYGQAAPGWQAASSQRLRWYSGVFQLQKKYALRLLQQGVLQRDWAALDQAVELLLPPLSLLALLPVGVTLLQLAWPALPVLLPWWVSLVAVLAWLLFPLLGLWLAGAPWVAYRALLYSPVYLLWRLWVGGQASLRRGRHTQWRRTRRHEELRRLG